ncbi:MAG: O-antigen ligase family protein [Phycisphaerales bacterium]
MDKQLKASTLGDRLALGGLWLVALLAVSRAMIEHDGFPWWASDPFVFSPPVVGLTPIQAIGMNLGVMLASGVSLIGLWIKGVRMGLISSACLTIGSLWIAYHAFHSIETVLIGSNLLAMMCVFFVASFAHKVGDAQRILAGVSLGFVLLLVVMGLYEVFVIHPETMKNFEHTRESFFAARGWTPGSFEALAYERRLSQPEPIAWFGLTNVYASFVGAGALAFVMLSWVNRHRAVMRLVCVAAALCSVLALMLSGAKGGIGAVGLGLLVFFVMGRFPKSSFTRNAMVISCSLVMLGLIVRGVIGERIGELSMFFRWQYLVGSWRMFVEHPIWGVGPGAFQEHYTLLKPDLSPEDVASPHNLPAALIALLGIGGIACVGVFISRLREVLPCLQSNGADADAVAAPPPIVMKRVVQLTILAIAIAAVISLRFGAPAMNMELVGVQVFGGLLWAGLALVIIRLDARELNPALLAGGLVLMIHAMIEVTPTWMVSGMLWALLVGLAVYGDGSHAQSDTTQQPNGAERVVRTMGSLPYGFLGLGLIVAGGAIGYRSFAIGRWERELYRAAMPAVPIAQEHDRLGGQTTPELNRREYASRQQAIEHLLEAVESRPTHMPTRIAASEQMLWFGSVHRSMNQPELARQDWERAIAVLEEGVVHSSGGSGYQWLGTVAYGFATAFPNAHDRDQWLKLAEDSWERGIERSPHNPHLAFKLMNLAHERGEGAKAKQWAQRARALHEMSRLDPLRGLSETDLEAVDRILAGDSD